MAHLLAHESVGHESRPLVSLDFHAQTGPDHSRGRRMTIWDKEVEKSKVIFNKVIAGRYKKDETGYEEVGVLLITWEKDDLHTRTKEVPRLRDIFQDQFGYTVEDYQIPSERSATGLAAALANFAHKYDSPNKMAIVYYGGHGDFIDNRFSWYAKQAGDGDGDPSAFFDDALLQLKLPDTDILTIIDCCYAARAFNRSEIGKRKFELLAATSASDEARVPQDPRSFTTALCDTLEDLLDRSPKGFTTSKLYQQVYFRQEDDRKPLLFDQSAFDYGKIWLRPFKRPTDTLEPTSTNKKRDPVAYIDLKLKLTMEPTPLVMNQLAVAMQYLPHVEELTFEHLHAPYKQLEEFMSGVQKAMLLRPLVAKLRHRRLMKKIRELSANGQLKNARQNVQQAFQTRLHTERRGSSVYDWSESRLQQPGKAQTPVSAIGRTDSPLSIHAEESDEDQTTHEEALEGAKVHHLGSWLSYVYTLDISGLKEYLGPVQGEMNRRVHMTRGDLAVGLGLTLLLLVSFAITLTSIWKNFFD